MTDEEQREFDRIGAMGSVLAANAAKAIEGQVYRAVLDMPAISAKAGALPGHVRALDFSRDSREQLRKFVAARKIDPVVDEYGRKPSEMDWATVPRIDPAKERAAMDAEVRSGVRTPEGLADMVARSLAGISDWKAERANRRSDRIAYWATAVAVAAIVGVSLAVWAGWIG